MGEWLETSEIKVLHSAVHMRDIYFQSFSMIGIYHYLGEGEVQGLRRLNNSTFLTSSI